MGSSAENFDAWFKERLEHFEESPGDAAWGHIAEKLGHTRKKRILVFVLRIAAGMALTLSMGLAYYYYTQQRGLSVQPSMSENRVSDQPIPATEPAMNSGVEKTDLRETIVSKQGTSSADLPENHSHAEIALSNISGQHAPPADSVIENEPFIAVRTNQPEGINALPAFIGYSPEIPGLALRQGGNRNRSLSETDLIVFENLAQMDAIDAGKKNDKEWMMGGQMAPLYSYRNLSSDYLDDQALNTLNKSENGVVAYAGGVALSYKPTKRLSVESGLYYSKYGQEKTDIKAVEGNRYPVSNNYESDLPDGAETVIQLTITNSTGTITDGGTSGAKFFYTDNSFSNGEETNANVLNVPTDKAGEIPNSDDLSAYQYFEYLEVPLIVKYKIVDRKLDFHLLGGISTNFLTDNSVTIDDNGEKFDYGKTNDIAKVNYAGSVGIGFEYPVLSNLLLNIEPKFRYYLNPIDKSVNLNVYPYSFGLFAGISYVF